MSKKLTIQDVILYVKENSECKLLSTTYVNARTKLLFECKCGKKFERTFDNFKRKKLLCVNRVLILDHCPILVKEKFLKVG